MSANPFEAQLSKKAALLKLAATFHSRGTANQTRLGWHQLTKINTTFAGPLGMRLPYGSPQWQAFGRRQARERMHEVLPGRAAGTPLRVRRLVGRKASLAEAARMTAKKPALALGAGLLAGLGGAYAWHQQHQKQR